MSEKFEMVAKTFQGLEGVLSDELKALGADDVKEGRRMVSKYTTVAGKEATFTDWWTWYIGRAYLQLLSGNRTNKANPMTLKQFGAL